MESAKDILFELRHKEKKISDLVRFLILDVMKLPITLYLWAQVAP